MIVLFIFFLLASFFLALKKPTYFVIFYLLASTKFLGFFDIEYFFVIGGTGLGMPSLNLVTFLASFFVNKWYRLPKRYLKFIIFFSFFLLYGIIYPSTMGYENLSQAIIASKEFWTIAILLYMVTHRLKIDIKILIKSIEFIGIYLALMYILYFLIHIAPPFYLETDHARGYYPTYMSLAMLLFYAKFQNHKSNAKLVNIEIILFIGIVLAGHFSLVVGTLFSLLLLSIFYSNNRFSFPKFLKKGFALLSIVFIVLISFSGLRNTIVNQYKMIVQGTDVALTSRDIYNEFRWKAISERPLTGYGFIHKSSPITTKFRTIENNRFAESFGVIDSGYLDLLVKFGYIGTIFYLLLWSRTSVAILLKPKKYNIMQLSLAAYLIQYFLISYTWSVFSFSHGLIPAFMAVFIIHNFTKGKT